MWTITNNCLQCRFWVDRVCKLSDEKTAGLESCGEFEKGEKKCTQK